MTIQYFFPKITGLVSALALIACTPGPTYTVVQKDIAIWDNIVRKPYIPQDRLQLSCLKHGGVFTKDKSACMVQAKGTCYYLTAPNDMSHDRELTAYCNGYRV